MKTKALQLFSDSYLENCKKLTPEQILAFLEDFRLIHGHENNNQKLKPISIKIPENLLNAYKMKAKLTNTPYQKLIKLAMKEYLKSI